MKTKRRAWWVLAAVPLWGWTGSGVAHAERPEGRSLPRQDLVSVDYCPTRRPHDARCFARHVLPRASAAATHRVTAADVALVPSCDGQPPAPGIGMAFGLSPADFANLYSIPATPTGAGKVVAIVAACSDATVLADVAAYRSNFGLPPLPECGGADGVAPASGGSPCLGVVDQTGGATLPPSDSGWAAEIALDVEMVSAGCPECSILLVEAASPSLADLGPAVNEAVTLGASAVTNSYGLVEDPDNPAGPAYSDAAYVADYVHDGVLVAAASGDHLFESQAFAMPNGNLAPSAPSFPASIPSVLSVGGTTVNPGEESTRGGFSEVVWNDSSQGTGSGCSTEFSLPSYQASLSMGACGMRASVDVSAAAQSTTGGIAAYVGGSWEPMTGTSAASAFVTAVLTRAGLADKPNEFFYANAPAFYDVTSGNNDPSGACTDVMCNAGTGWDGPSGLGTPNVGALAAFVATGGVTDGGDAGTPSGAPGGASDGGMGHGGPDSGGAPTDGGKDSGGSGGNGGGTRAGSAGPGSGGGGVPPHVGTPPPSSHDPWDIKCDSAAVRSTRFHFADFATLAAGVALAIARRRRRAR